MIENVIARPMWRRFIHRSSGQDPEPLNDDDRRDAIRVLREVHVDGYGGWWMAVMQIEAELVLSEAGS